MKGARMGFNEISACDHLIMRGELDGAEKQKPSYWGLVLPGRCDIRAEEGRGGYNRDG